MTNKPYILCADDLQMNQIVITEMLEKHFFVECINHGSECLDSIAQKRPDLILMGESMPIRDDYDICKNLREDSRYKEIPIISLSCEHTEHDASVVQEDLYDLYLSKPIDEEQLITSIKHLLSS